MPGLVYGPLWSCRCTINLVTERVTRKKSRDRNNVDIIGLMIVISMLSINIWPMIVVVEVCKTSKCYLFFQSNAYSSYNIIIYFIQIINSVILSNSYIVFLVGL